MKKTFLFFLALSFSFTASSQPHSQINSFAGKYSISLHDSTAFHMLDMEQNTWVGGTYYWSSDTLFLNIKPVYDTLFNCGSKSEYKLILSKNGSSWRYYCNKEENDNIFNQKVDGYPKFLILKKKSLITTNAAGKQVKVARVYKITLKRRLWNCYIKIWRSINLFFI